MRRNTKTSKNSLFTAVISGFSIFLIGSSTVSNVYALSTNADSTVLFSSERVTIQAVHSRGTIVPQGSPLISSADRLGREIQERILPLFPKKLNAVDVDQLKISLTVFSTLPSPYEKRAALWAETDAELDAGDPIIDIAISELTFLNPEAAYTLAAHEIFHGVHARVHREEKLWINEGLAHVFEWIANQQTALSYVILKYGFMIQTKFASDFDLSSNSESTLGGYGLSFIYFMHLYKHCGGEKLFWKIVQSPNEGLSTVSWALRDLSNDPKSPIPTAKRWSCERLENHYETFILARYLNQSRAIEPYGPTLRIHGGEVAGKNYTWPEKEITPALIEKIRSGIPVIFEGTTPINALQLPNDIQIRYFDLPMPEATWIHPQAPQWGTKTTTPFQAILFVFPE